MKQGRFRRTPSLWRHMSGRLGGDIGIDLGTVNTLVFVPGQGVVLHEPSVIAFGPDRRKVIAVGGEAKRMIGRSSQRILPIRPLRGGVITDLHIVREMLRHFIHRVWRGRSPFRPRIVVAVPAEATDVERGALQEAIMQVGARQVCLIEEPLAAAIGAGLPFHEPTGNMVVDIGGGRTEVAVLSMGGVVVRRSLPIAGDSLDEGIVGWVRHRHNVLIGEPTAEAVKITVGSVLPADDDRRIVVHGRDLSRSLPCDLEISSGEVGEALAQRVDHIVETVHAALTEAPPELAADIMDRGIVLTGGTAQLQGLDRALAKRTGLPVVVADQPLLCVARGVGRILDEPDVLGRLAERPT